MKSRTSFVVTVVGALLLFGVALALLRRAIASSELAIFSVILLGTFLVLMAYFFHLRLKGHAEGKHEVRRSIVECIQGLGLGLSAAGATVFIFSFFAWDDISLSRLDSTAVGKLIVLSAAPAVVEEIVFRGFLLGIAVRLLGRYPPVANGIQSAVFAIAHAGTPQFDSNLYALQVLVAGFTLGTIALKSGFLWASMGFHFAWNFSTYLLFGVHKKMISPISGALMGFPDGLLFSRVALTVSVLVLVFVLLNSMRPNRPK